VQPGECIDSHHTPEFLHLNTSALSDPLSLKPLVSVLDYAVDNVITLVDCGSSHCFVDPTFTKAHSVILEEIPPIPLHLFDGSCNAEMTLSEEPRNLS
jgi:hypothetical protein